MFKDGWKSINKPAALNLNPHRSATRDKAGEIQCVHLGVGATWHL